MAVCDVLTGERATMVVDGQVQERSTRLSWALLINAPGTCRGRVTEMATPYTRRPRGVCREREESVKRKNREYSQLVWRDVCKASFIRSLRRGFDARW